MKPRDNPFASHRVESVGYRFQRGCLEDLVDRVGRPGFRGALVGPKGHGKTTLLEEIAAALEARGRRVRMLRLSESGGCVAGRRAEPGEIILLDGAELLDPLAWWRFRWRMRRADSLLITTHCAGRLPTLFRCETTPALLTDIILHLHGAESSLAGEASLFARHRGDIRQALRECYDRVAA